MMTCKEVLDSLSAYVDADMKDEVAAEMKKHIGMCSDCRAEFDSLTMTIKLYHHSDKTALPTGCHDRLIKILELERMKSAEEPPDTSATDA
jgi:predicted anti-sigma-YlaC factor YlaD